MSIEPVSLVIDDATRVSALWQRPVRADATFVFAHGAGAGMQHAFMADVANRLAEQRIATLRFQFPYIERGSRRPDAPEICHRTVRAAVAEAARRAPALPLVAGGKSFGGRMTSQAQATEPVPGVQALAFVGFPLHPAQRPSTERAKHLAAITVPMLFLQGTRDSLADLELLQDVVARLGWRASLVLLEHADHAFHVPVRSGRTNEDVLGQLTGEFAAWIRRVVRG